jgi:hypothetical protein
MPNERRKPLSSANIEDVVGAKPGEGFLGDAEFGRQDGGFAGQWHLELLAELALQPPEVERPDAYTGDVTTGKREDVLARYHSEPNPDVRHIIDINGRRPATVEGDVALTEPPVLSAEEDAEVRRALIARDRRTAHNPFRWLDPLYRATRTRGGR